MTQPKQPQPSPGRFGITPAGRKRLRVAMFFALLFMGLGFYGGVSAAKKALVGPIWMQRALGIVILPAPPMQAPGPLQQQQQMQAPPINPADDTARNTAPDNMQRGAQPGQDQSQASQVNGSSEKGPAAPAPSVIGSWEITDEVHYPGAPTTTATSRYVFEKDGKGAFYTNGKKLADFTYEDTGDLLKVAFTGDSIKETSSKVEFLYSVNEDGSLLTLSPKGNLDPRGDLYHVGAGVYHRK
jgi:hypothetical protein